MKQIIKITENELRNLVMESARRIMNEDFPHLGPGHNPRSSFVDPKGDMDGGIMDEKPRWKYIALDVNSMLDAKGNECGFDAKDGGKSRHLTLAKYLRSMHIPVFKSRNEKGLGCHPYINASNAFSVKTRCRNCEIHFLPELSTTRDNLVPYFDNENNLLDITFKGKGPEMY